MKNILLIWGCILFSGCTNSQPLVPFGGADSFEMMTDMWGVRCGGGDWKKDSDRGSPIDYKCKCPKGYFIGGIKAYTYDNGTSYDKATVVCVKE